MTRESNSSASFEPGDFCLYAFGKENKSKAVVEVVKVLDDPRGVAQVKFHRVLADDTGNGLFNYLRRTGDTMNASFEYLKKVAPKAGEKVTVKDAENISFDPDVYSRCVATANGILPDVATPERDRRGDHPRDACAGWATEGQRYGGPYRAEGREDPPEAAGERPENSGGGTGRGYRFKISA